MRKQLTMINNHYSGTIKRCIRLFVLEIVALCIYIPVMASINMSLSNSTPKLFSEFNIDNIISFFNIYVPNLGFLWFINAIIICYLLFPFINKIKFLHDKKAVVIPITVLVVVYILRFFANKYSNSLGFFSNVMLTRNFLLTGVPCFLIGLFIHDHLNDLKFITKIRSMQMLFLFIILMITSVIEGYFHQLFGAGENEFYLSSILLAIVSICFALSHTENRIGDVLFYTFGKEIMLVSYLSHRLFIGIGTLFIDKDCWYLFYLFTIGCVLILGLLVQLVINIYKNVRIKIDNAH